VQLFALSLCDTQVKVTITTRYTDTLATAIDAAIWIINVCQLAPVTNQSDTEAEAMEWTNPPLYNVQVQQVHLEKSQMYSSSAVYGGRQINAQPFEWMLRLFDNKGQPVCGFCGSQHRSVDCQIPEAKQFWKQ
jgi:hypothetical protein